MRALAIFAVLIAGCSAPLGRAPRDPPMSHEMGPFSGPAPSARLPHAADESIQRNPIYRVLSYAEAQIGKPYCWGGEGPRCFDCSGLAQMAWAHAGIHIPRTSHDMARSLPEVPLRSVRAGDILWWPGHVAIYEGDGHMIDAFNSREGVVRRPTMSERPRRAFRPI